MSFLAKLRSQVPVSNEQQLCYLIEPSGAKWLLTLQLATLKNGVLNYFESPYTVARSHLKVPPAFLTKSDVAIVEQLVKANEAWFSQSSVELRGPHTLSILQQLVASNKCFIKTEETPLLIKLGQPISVSPHWLVNTDGSQQFCLDVPNNFKLVVMGDVFLAFQYSEQTVHPIQKSDSSRYFEWHNFCVSCDQVEAFLQVHSRLFVGRNWPMPLCIPVQTLAAPLHPILLAQTVHDAHGTKHQLALAFRVTTEQCCLQVAYASKDDDWTVYSDQKIYRIAIDQSICDKAHSFICESLGTNIGLIAEGVWEVPTKAQWQNIFFEQQTQFLAYGIHLVTDTGFAYPYVVAQGVEFSAVASGEQLTLDLTTQLNGNTVSLLELLKTLRQQKGGAFVELLLEDNQLLLLPRAALDSLCSELGDWVHSGCKPVALEQSYRLHQLKNQCLDGIDINCDTALEAANVWLPPKEVVIEKNTVNAQLRPYQWLGVYWMLHIHDCGFNGLLADDMGLGKTLQTITFLSVLKQQNRLQNTAIIVAPTSLLHNWLSEFNKFCPSLDVVVSHGTKRHSNWERFSDFDVVITSYQSLVNDVERWQSQPVSWLILDEAQTIKNPSTQVRQTLAQLACDNRLCLSGTPVENHLGDIWSLLDFLNPGILGGLTAFKQYYQNPIEKQGNEERLKHLLDRVAPFVLRRTKTEVAPDLPEKSEFIQTIELPEAQYDYYDKVKNEYWQQLQSDLIGQEHQGQKHLLVLTALLKLRQLCCDPRLLKPESQSENEIPSGKTEYCINMLQELVEEGRSVLVFSQFTSMLDILAGELCKIDIPFLQLTGKTQNRGELVESFQAGGAPIFLISLKAGGSGLNLTQADTVIHFDPWWNQAAQAQASDRAHRIGQDKPVFVYKLIAQNTIEEKIAVLQASKEALSDAVNQTAQASAQKFALGFDELLALWN